MPLSANKVPPSQVINFTLSYFFNAARKTNITSKKEIAKMRAEELRLTPQNIGDFSKRISINDQLSKSRQQSFIDIFI